jgi:hypothetical protein
MLKDLSSKRLRVVGEDFGERGGAGKQRQRRAADSPGMPVTLIDQVESLHDRGLVNDRQTQVLSCQGSSVDLPTMPE